MRRSAVQASKLHWLGTAGCKRRRLQFSLRTVLFFMVYLALSFGAVRLLWIAAGGNEYHLSILRVLGVSNAGWLGLCTFALFFIAAFGLLTCSEPESVWNTLALAWFVVAANLVVGICTGYYYESQSAAFQGKGVQLEMFYSGLRAVTLPVLLTIPMACVLVVDDRWSTKGKWTLIAPAVAIFDVAVLVVSNWILMDLY